MDWYTRVLTICGVAIFSACFMVVVCALTLDTIVPLDLACFAAIFGAIIAFAITREN